MNNRRRNIEELAVFVGLVAVGLVVRYTLHTSQLWPGAFPALAIGLFAGFYFRSLLVASAVPLLIQGISDLWLDGYDIVTKLSVYAMLILPVLSRSIVRSHWQVVSRDFGRMLRNWAALAGCTWGAAILFFVVTNFAFYCVWHDTTWSELVRCFTLAIPFFRVMLVSNTVTMFTLLGAYQCLTAINLLRQPADTTPAYVA